MPIMPRKATTPDPEVPIVIEKINRFRTSNAMSVLALAKDAEVSQPALKRFLDGDRKTVTSVAKATLSHIDSWHNRHNHSDGAILSPIPKPRREGYDLMIGAIESLWDGQYQSAQLIASLVIALRPALEIAAHSNAAGQKGT